MAESGDLAIPLEQGVIDERAIAGELTDVCAGTVGRRSKDDITIHKSVGAAFEDLIVAAEAHRLQSSA